RSPRPPFALIGPFASVRLALSGWRDLAVIFPLIFRWGDGGGRGAFGEDGRALRAHHELPFRGWRCFRSCGRTDRGRFGAVHPGWGWRFGVLVGERLLGAGFSEGNV